MIYGQDDPMLFPVADLYDSGMMNMYINAAREQYNQNREDMKDFMKTYGDFISPISADMDWVDQQTRGRINDALNYLQQNGIDPLRSAEGRAIIQRVIRDTPTAGINARRQSAENAKEYLKNKAALERQGLYNPNFESYRLGGNTINNWNTGDNGIWQETSPLEYKDLNEYTGHIFDKMEDEFISSDGIYDYTGVSRERRNQALTQQIGGLLNTPLGRFHYENSRANAAAILGREPTEEEVLNQFKNDILTATVEYERRNRKENPEYARQREFYYDDKLDAAKTARDINAYRQKAAIDAAYDPSSTSSSSSSGSGSGSGAPTNEGYSWMRDTYNSFLANAASDGALQYNWRNIGDYYNQISDNILDTQKAWFNVNKGNTYKDTKSRMIKKYSLPIDQNSIISFSGNTPLSGNKNSVMYARSEDIDNLYTTDAIVQGTYGYQNTKDQAKKIGPQLIRKQLEKYGVGSVTIHPTGEGYGATMKDGTFHVYAKVKVVGKNPTNGKTVRYNMYLDTGIKSNPGVLGKNTVNVTGGLYKPEYDMFNPDVELGYKTTPFRLNGTITEDRANMFPIDSPALNNKDTRVSTSLGAGQSVKKATY